MVDNNSDTPATRPPLKFTRVDGLVVRGNTQLMVRPGETAVSATDVCGLSVAGNDLASGTLPLQVTRPRHHLRDGSPGGGPGRARRRRSPDRRSGDDDDDPSGAFHRDRPVRAAACARRG